MRVEIVPNDAIKSRVVPGPDVAMVVVKGEDPLDVRLQALSVEDPAEAVEPTLPGLHDALDLLF